MHALPQQIRRRGALLLAALAIGLSGCTTVGPDYRAPVVTVPARWSEAAPGMTDTDRAPSRLWWRSFEDPMLDRLVAQALAQNQNLAIALARLRQAHAERVQIAAAAEPEVSVGATGLTQRSSKALDASAYGVSRSWEMGMEASWELDLFGGTRRAVEAADAGIDALSEDRRALQLSLVAELVSDYAGLRATQYRLGIVQDNLRTLGEDERLAQRAYRAGLGPQADVTQARAERETAEAQPPLMEADIARFIHAIGVLTGGFPGDWHTALIKPGPTLSLPTRLPLSFPSEVIRQRPDLRADERRLAAASARIGVAEAARFPRFIVPLGVGTSASVFHSLFSGASLAWSAGMQGSLPLYDGGRARAGVTAARADADAARLVYERDVHLALRDVEDALTTWTGECRRQAALQHAVADSRQAWQYASRRYRRGLSAYLPVLVARRTLNQARDAQALSQLDAVRGAVAVYRSLGTGLPARDAP